MQIYIGFWILLGLVHAVVRVSPVLKAPHSYEASADSIEDESLQSTLCLLIQASDRVQIRGIASDKFAEMCAFFGQVDSLEQIEEEDASIATIERGGEGELVVRQGSQKARVIIRPAEEDEKTTKKLFGALIGKREEDEERKGKVVLVSKAELEALAVKALSDRGCSKFEAETTARELVAAEEDDKSAHGLVRLKELCAAIDKGTLKANARIKLKAHKGIIRAHGGGGLAFSARQRALSLLKKRARRHGVAALFLTETRSISGRLAPVVEELARDKFIAICCVNTPAYVCFPASSPSASAAPKKRSSWWSPSSVRNEENRRTEPSNIALRVLGTNPIAFGCPTSDDPIVVDMATSAASRGELETYRSQNRPLPPGLAVDSHGRETRDAAQALETGAQLPAAGSKGALLALLIEILAGLLTESDLATDSSDYNTMNRGCFILAIDAQRLSSLSLDRLLLSIPRPPGQSARNARQHAAAINGIPIDLNTLLDLAALYWGRTYGQEDSLSLDDEILLAAANEEEQEKTSNDIESNAIVESPVTEQESSESSQTDSDPIKANEDKNLASSTISDEERPTPSLFVDEDEDSHSSTIATQQEEERA